MVDDMSSSTAFDAASDTLSDAEYLRRMAKLIDRCGLQLSAAVWYEILLDGHRDGKEPPGDLLRLVRSMLPENPRGPALAERLCWVATGMEAAR